MAMNRDDRTLEFGPYRLDLARAQLWREGEPVRLRPKSWEMLCYLAERPGVLVPFDVLLDVVWPGIAVTPKVLTNVIGELRKALCDEARTPRVIETIHRRGYRFIASVATRDPSNRDASAAVTAQGEGVATVMAMPVLGAAASLGLGDLMTHGAFTPPPAIFVGRAAELETLGAAWQMALRGHRQVVFVTGEAGIGKTGVLDTFVHRLHADARGVAFLSGRGQSVEKFGAHEPFRPVIEILNELASGGQTTDLLRRYAPSWLVQIPWLLPPAEIQALREALAGIGSGAHAARGVRLSRSVVAGGALTAGARGHPLVGSRYDGSRVLVRSPDHADARAAARDVPARRGAVERASDRLGEAARAAAWAPSSDRVPQPAAAVRRRGVPGAAVRRPRPRCEVGCPH